jgi:hypothetical protein
MPVQAGNIGEIRHKWAQQSGIHRYRRQSTGTMTPIEMDRGAIELCMPRTGPVAAEIITGTRDTATVTAGQAGHPVPATRGQTD